MIEEEKKSNSFSSIIYRVFPYVWMAAGYLCNILFQLKYSAAYVDSDMSAEMVLSNLVNSEGSIISKHYYYSTELRVFSTQWFYRIGLWLFPDNWHMARVFGAALLVACFLLCYLYFAIKAKLHIKGIFTAAALMWPFGHLFFYLALYGTYYLVYMMIALLSMGLLFSIIEGKQKGLKLALLIVLAFLSGLNGVRELLIFYVPLLTAVCILIFYQKNKEETDAPFRKPAVYALLAVLASGAGYLINSKILAKSYTFYQTSGVALKSADHISELLNAWNDFLQIFGYQSGVKLFSFSGIASVFGILLELFFLFSLFRLIKRFSSLSNTYRLTVLLMLCILAIDGMAYAFLDIVYVAGFWVPTLPFAFAVMQIEADTEPLFDEPLKTAGRAAFALMIVCCAFSTWSHEIESPYRAKKGLYETAVWLKDNGYTEGYADFWNSAAVIEMSDNAVDVWTLSDTNSTNIYRWLQVKSHDNAPTGKVFLLHENSTGGVYYEKSEIVYQNEQYTVYVFANAETLSEALTIANTAVQ